MKYYNDTDYKKECYIKEIHVNEKDIKVDYADGKTEVLPYSKEKELELKNKMNLQKDSYVRNVDNKVHFAPLSYPILILAGLLVLSNFVPALSALAMYAGVGAFATVLPYTVYKQVRATNKKKLTVATEILKHEEMHEYVANKMQKENKKTLSLKGRKIMKSNTDYNRDPFTLNDLDKYTLLDLLTIESEIKDSIRTVTTEVKVLEKK